MTYSRRLGLTREELRRQLGEPDAEGYRNRRLKNPSCLKYGDTEYHFVKDRVVLIYREDSAGKPTTLAKL